MLEYDMENFIGINPTINCSEENPELHLLYVRWAMHHLTVVDNAVKELYDFSNINTSFLANTLLEAMQKLVKEDAAYRDAAALLFINEALPVYCEFT